MFGGFSPEAVKDRINDCEAKVLVTADFSLRRGKPEPMKEAIDAVLGDCPSIEHVVVVRRTGGDVPWTDGRDVWWHEAVEAASPDCAAEPFDAEQMLFLLYTSGTTAKPKGIVHTSGGYLTGVMATHNLVFDIKPDKDVYWCSADIGWVTGHSYIVYGPLANGCTSILYEGAPDYPDKDRWWDIAERYKCHDLLHGARPRSARASSGAASTPTATTSRRCGCSAAWASRSTRARGSGTTR